MPDRAEILAYGTGGAALVLLVVVVASILLRYRQRRVPTALAWIASLTFGLSLSTSFIILVKQPLLLAGALVFPALVVVALMRFGRFRTAGILLIGLCLPGAAWWGSFLVQDATDPLVAYEPSLWTWWLPEVVGLVMALGLVIIGDRPGQAPAQLVAPPAGVVRDPMVIGNAIFRKLLIGPFTLPSVIADGAAFLVVMLGLPPAMSAGVPWPLALLAGAVAFALTSTLLWYPAIPRRTRDAWEGFASVGQPEMERWRRETGTDVPTSFKGMAAWLRDNPERPENRWARAELLAVQGQLDEARAVAERMDTAEPADALERAALLGYITWIGGGDPGIDELARLAERVGDAGSDERRMAHGRVTLARARALAADGGDWMTPLVGLRRDIGPIAARWFRQDTLPKRFRVMLPVGLALSGLVILANQLPAG